MRRSSEGTGGRGVGAGGRQNEEPGVGGITSQAFALADT